MGHMTPDREPQATPKRISWAARGQLESIDRYLQRSEGSAGNEAFLQECLVWFYELAAPQLAEQMVDARLFAQGEMTSPQDILRAIDAQLAAWQRGGLVPSQVQVLADFTEALAELQRAILDEEDLDPGLRRLMERQLQASQQA